MAFTRSDSKIHFFFEKVAPALRNREKLKNFINSVFRKEGKQLSSINYIFSTDEALLKINRQYLDHDFYTDVISFNLSDRQDEIVADIYISLDRIRENAKNLKRSVEEELHRVIFHGTLHLCDYNDKSDSQKVRMKRKEDFYVAAYFHIKKK